MVLERRISHPKPEEISDVTDSSNEIPQKVPFGARHIQVALTYFGLINYGIQYASLSVALVGMTDKDPSTGPVLNYTLSDKGTISGLFLYGVMMGMIPAGYLISFYQPMRVMSTLSGIVSGILTILFPYAAVHCGFVVACIVRVLVGMAQSSVNSGPYAHLSQWVVSQEQDKFSFVWGGANMGCAAILGVSGVLVSRAGGWPTVFYVSGCYSILWGLIGWFLGVESPGKHPSITPVEKGFLQSNVAIKREGKIKWRKMLTSAPVWALLITHACEHITTNTVSSLLPTFLDKVLNFSVDKIGYISSGIDIAVIICSFGIAYLANKLAKHISANVSRKLWNTIGLCGSAIPLFLLYVAKDDSVVVVSMILIFSILTTAKLPGHMTNTLELAPSHSGTIASVMMFSSNLIAFTGPILAGVVIIDERDPEDWWNAWCAGALLNVFGAVIFLVFGSSEVQPWNNED